MKVSGGAIEPTIAPISGGRLLMLVRVQLGEVWQATSSDGLEWSSLTRTSLDLGGTLHMIRLADGRLALVRNPADQAGIAKYGRPIGYDLGVLTISADDGGSWSGPVEVVRESNPRVAHLTLVEPTPGTLLIAMPGHPFLLRGAP
jgi:hypothetical protein